MRLFGWRAGAGVARPEVWLGMSRTGRAAARPDAVTDGPRRETAAGVECGTVLTDAHARRECALAYRATVDAVYAEAELGAGARWPGDGQAVGYPAVMRPGITIAATAPRPQVRALRERGAWTRKTGQSRGTGSMQRT